MAKITNLNTNKTIDVTVEEKPTGEIFAGAGTGTSGSSLTAGIKENNYLGLGIKLDTNLNLTEDSIKGKFSILNPNYNNSDKSIKKIKSEDRPIISELDRAYVLSCLTSVDHVILFDDETPEKISSKILPDILVKGSDYQGKKIAGEEILSKHNKKIILLDVISGKSSTSIIDKILKL